MVRSFPVEIAAWDEAGELVTFELFYTGGDTAVRIRDGELICDGTVLCPEVP
jgi:hypothetical protein